MVTSAQPKAAESVVGPIRNLRNEASVELKRANLVYTDCVSKQFLPGWLKGEALQLNTDVCGAEYEDLLEKNAAVYGEFPMPFQTLKIPSAPPQ